MLQQHGIRGPQFGDFVQAAGDEVAGGFAEGVGGEVRGCAVDDGLPINCISNDPMLYERECWFELTDSWEKILS